MIDYSTSGLCACCAAALPTLEELEQWYHGPAWGPPDNSDAFVIRRIGVPFRYPLTTLVIMGAGALIWTYLLAVGFRALWRSLLASP